MEPTFGDCEDILDGLFLLDDALYREDVLAPLNPFEECLGDKAEFHGKDDEGFDEGFCEDGEMPQDEKDGESRVPAMVPLDLQHLLDNATPATALEVRQPTAPQDEFEFDLGVDMLDAEHIQQGLVDSKTLVASNPHRMPSTYVGVLTSPDTQSSSSVLFEDVPDDMNYLCQQQMVAELNMDRTNDSCPLDICLTDCDLGTSYNTGIWDATGPLSSPLSPMTTPTHTSLTEVISVPLPANPTPDISDTRTPGSLQPHSPPLKQPISSPSPSTPSSTVAKGNDDVTKTGVTPEIIEMPFYQFKKILECPDLPEQKKVEVKNIRRRGKNKMAAKNCRQRKLEVIMGLKQEVDRLKEAAARMIVKNKGLEKEIETFRLKCFQLTSSSGSTNQKQLLSS